MQGEDMPRIQGFIIRRDEVERLDLCPQESKRFDVIDILPGTGVDFIRIESKALDCRICQRVDDAHVYKSSGGERPVRLLEDGLQLDHCFSTEEIVSRGIRSYLIH